jgi:hypothetical protein
MYFSWSKHSTLGVVKMKVLEKYSLPKRVFPLEASAFIKCLYQSEIVMCSVVLDSVTC